MSNSRLFKQDSFRTHTHKSCKIINQYKSDYAKASFALRQFWIQERHEHRSPHKAARESWCRQYQSIYSKSVGGSKYGEIMANHLIQFQRPLACSSVGHSFKLAHAFWASGMAMAKPVFTTPCRTPNQSSLREIENVDMVRDVSLASSIR